MIDMHLRILPGIDDGPETMEGSLATPGDRNAVARPVRNAAVERGQTDRHCTKCRGKYGIDLAV